MVNKAKSQLLKRQILRKEMDDLKAYAARLYRDEQERPLAPGEKKKSTRQICQEASDTLWKVREMDRKERNTALKAGWEVEVQKWVVERDSAKVDRRKPRWTRPKMPTMEKAIRKPAMADFATVDRGDGEDEEEDDPAHMSDISD